MLAINYALLAGLIVLEGDLGACQEEPGGVPNKPETNRAQAGRCSKKEKLRFNCADYMEPMPGWVSYIENEIISDVITCWCAWPVW